MHEVIRYHTIKEDLPRGPLHQELRDHLAAELERRVSFKLSVGDRAVIVQSDLVAEQRATLAATATSHGAPVFEYVNRKSLPVRRIGTFTFDALRANWRGVTVVGDVHGNLGGLRKAIAWAESRQNFLWMLGDVIDCGEDTLKAVEVVYRMVMDGKAGLALGNHERKIAKWLTNRESGRGHTRLSDGNRVTVEALERLTKQNRRRWIGRFRALIGQAAMIQELGSAVMVHAAVHPSFWTCSDTGQVEHYALYGESDFSTGRYRQTHRWVDAVPSGKMVLVGHEMVASLPTVVTGKKGGQVVFLDTGSGKGGYLSTADLRFCGDDLHLECFNRH